MSASSSSLAGTFPVGRLLSHVVEATAHAGQLGAAAAVSVRVLNRLVFKLIDAGQLDTSRPLLDQALAIAEAQLGPDHPNTLTTRGNLASWLGEAGQVPEAITQTQQLLDDRARVQGPDHPDTLRTRRYTSEAVMSGSSPLPLRMFSRKPALRL